MNTTTATEATTLQKTFGIFVEQAAAINDRLFLTAAVRSDQNSAFGTDFNMKGHKHCSLRSVTNSIYWQKLYLKKRYC